MDNQSPERFPVDDEQPESTNVNDLLKGQYHEVKLISKRGKMFVVTTGKFLKSNKDDKQ